MFVDIHVYVCVLVQIYVYLCGKHYKHASGAHTVVFVCISMHMFVCVYVIEFEREGNPAIGACTVVCECACNGYYVNACVSECVIPHLYYELQITSHTSYLLPTTQVCDPSFASDVLHDSNTHVHTLTRDAQEGDVVQTLFEGDILPLNEVSADFLELDSRCVCVIGEAECVVV